MPAAASPSPDPPLAEGDVPQAGALSVDRNIAVRLAEAAAQRPDERAVLVPPDAKGRGGGSKTFAELDEEANAVARGLLDLGAGPESRLVMAVRPGLDFLSIAFGLFRSRATAVLIDPGMGRKNVVACLAEANVDGVVGIPLAQAMRRLKRAAFPNATVNVCVGRGLPGFGVAYERLLAAGRKSQTPIAATRATDAAAIIFTSGSTGPPKGVCYEHGMFDAQWQLIRDEYDIEPGTCDVACFPLFGLFNVAMGVTTIWPRIDFANPATADSETLADAFAAAAQSDEGEPRPVQSFASPAIWKTLADDATGKRVLPPTLTQALSAGAPVPPRTLAAIRKTMPGDGRFHTPYGATESLPACTIESREVLQETAAATAGGQGTCVGRPFRGVDVRVIRRPTRTVADILETEEASVGEIGEILVRSPAVTREYFNRPEATAATKIADGDRWWHRIGDVGYFDEQGRLWFCGRISHIVPTPEGPLYPVCLEPLFNADPFVERTALVGFEHLDRRVTPVLVCELARGSRFRIGDRENVARQVLRTAGGHADARRIRHVVVQTQPLPVDARHNAKIRREQIAAELDWKHVLEVNLV